MTPDDRLWLMWGGGIVALVGLLCLAVAIGVEIGRRQQRRLSPSPAPFRSVPWTHGPSGGTPIPQATFDRIEAELDNLDRQLCVRERDAEVRWPASWGDETDARHVLAVWRRLPVGGSAWVRTRAGEELLVNRTGNPTPRPTVESEVDDRRRPVRA